MVAGELGLPLDQAIALERRTGGRFRFLYQPGLLYEHMDLRHDPPEIVEFIERCFKPATKAGGARRRTAAGARRGAHKDS